MPPLPARLVRLRIAGFKSFAEPSSIDILPGLTGVVGPNGCGKSNVVEALRWTMGETSARAMRGGEMDDVIFAGTAARAARNLAEVTITLEGAAGLAPQPFHEADELQVTRRIERGGGSQYRINGRDARARDVQTLFADLASGARSSAMVSQGRVAAIVGARPEERRAILEEAAGITGLHARRHEAELKLRATEANLARAEDLAQGHVTRLEALTRQAEQAARYRVVAGGLREAEATLEAVIHARARQAVGRRAAESDRARTAARAAEDQARQTGDAAEAIAATLPALRETETQARTVRERCRIALSAVAEAAARDVEALDAAQARLAQAQADAEAAAARYATAAETLATLQAGIDGVQARLDSLPPELDTARQALTHAIEAHEAAAQAAERAADRQASAAREQASAADRAQAADAAVLRLLARRDGLATEIAAAQAALPGTEQRATAARAARQATDTLDHAGQELMQAGAAREEATAARAAMRERLTEARSRSEALDRSRDVTRQRMRRLAETETELDHQAEAARAHLDPGDAPDWPGRLRRLDDAAEQARAALGEAGAAHLAAQREAMSAQAAQAVAQDETERLQAVRQAAAERLARLETLHEDLARAHDAALAELGDGIALHEADVARDAAEQALIAAGTALAEAGRAAAASEAAAREAGAGHQRAAAGLESVQAQIDGLAGGLEELPGGAAGPSVTPLAARVSVPAGLEAAIASCLGDALEAPIGAAPDGATAVPWWRADLAGEGAPPPKGTTPLASLVGTDDAPAARVLARALGGIGLVGSAAEFDAAWPDLTPGQMLVTREGALRRWDGYARPAGHDPAAERLRQRARLARLRAEAHDAAARLAEAQAAARRADDLAKARAATLHDARIARDAAETHAAEARAIRAARSARDAAMQGRIDALAPQRAQAAGEHDAARRDSASATAAAGHAPDMAAATRRLQTARDAEQQAASRLDTARAASQAAEAGLAQARRDAAAHEAARAEAQGRLASVAPQRERLAAETAELTLTLAELDAAIAALPDADQQARAGAEAERVAQAAETRLATAQAAREQAQAARMVADASAAALETEAGAQSARIAALTPQHQAVGEDADRAAEALALALAARAALPDADELRTLARELADTALAAAASRQQAQASFDALSREAEAGGIRRAGLAEEVPRWSAEVAVAAQARDTQLMREAEAHAAVAAQAARAAAHPEREAEARTAEAAAAADWTRAQAELAAQDERLDTARLAARDAALAAAGARETAVRTDALHTQAAEALAALLNAADQAGHHLPDFVPDDLSDAAEAGLRRRVARLLRERDEIGPVNLQAETEATQLAELAAGLLRDRTELEDAIGRLRGTIGALNKEGRERLSAVFRQVDAHFQALFCRMFGGGRAHLGMVGSDDPLEAGLEIYAQPPGKKLATLSLLSGGEQALTALSLIFAVFGCNPAPVCVLDEVDAPLDDANVQRFTNLLADMVTQTGTRFLVVTHHQLTMAQMDRLYGVTMQERGVSRLLSVDLQTAGSMIDR